MRTAEEDSGGQDGPVQEQRFGGRVQQRSRAARSGAQQSRDQDDGVGQVGGEERPPDQHRGGAVMVVDGSREAGQIETKHQDQRDEQGCVWPVAVPEERSECYELGRANSETSTAPLTRRATLSGLLSKAIGRGELSIPGLRRPIVESSFGFGSLANSEESARKVLRGTGQVAEKVNFPQDCRKIC